MATANGLLAYSWWVKFISAHVCAANCNSDYIDIEWVYSESISMPLLLQIRSWQYLHAFSQICICSDAQAAMRLMVKWTIWWINLVWVKLFCLWTTSLWNGLRDMSGNPPKWLNHARLFSWKQEIITVPAGQAVKSEIHFVIDLRDTPRIARWSFDHVGRWIRKYITRWWFQIFSISTPTWGNDPIWRAYFSNRLKPPTRSDLSHPVPCIAVRNGAARTSGILAAWTTEDSSLAADGGVPLSEVEVLLINLMKYWWFRNPTPDIWLIFIYLTIIHQLPVYGWYLSHYFQGEILHPRWCRSSSINSWFHILSSRCENWFVFKLQNHTISNICGSVPGRRLPHNSFVLIYLKKIYALDCFSCFHEGVSVGILIPTEMPKLSYSILSSQSDTFAFHKLGTLVDSEDESLKSLP